jgi:hypothetical protein
MDYEKDYADRKALIIRRSVERRTWVRKARAALILSS